MEAIQTDSAAARRRVPESAQGDCLACGASSGRVLLSADDVRCEQRWLERFHDARIASDADDAKDRATFTQSEDRHVLACDACQTVRRVPRPSPDEIERAYAQDEYGDEMLARLAANQDAFFTAKLAQLAPALDAIAPGDRVLEIGSFVGGFLRAARQQGWRATGIDVGDETSRFTRARGFDVVQGDLLDLDLPGGYAAVFVWSTFDQLAEPAAVLDRVRRLLRPRGLLILRVPNGRFETATLALRRGARRTRRACHVLCAQAYANFVTFPYLTGYTPESLCGLLEAHHFACAQVTGDNILRLADDRTLPFAVREEARAKRAVRRACRLAERATGLLFDPWLDVVARSA